MGELIHKYVKKCKKLVASCPSLDCLIVEHNQLGL